MAEHARETAAQAAKRAQFLALSRCAALSGLAHDLGKYAGDMQQRIRGADIRVEHSTAGAAVLRECASSDAERVAAELLGYAIAGHHAGLPDMTGGDASLMRRLETYSDRLDPRWRGEIALDLDGVAEEIAAHIGPEREHAAFDFSLVVRMLFSCLVDADFRDTEAHYDRIGGLSRDRDWPTLGAHLDAHRGRLDAHLAGLGQGGEINAIRREIMAAVRAKAAMPPGLFTLTVPTGGGKTLVSLAFALDHAAAHGLRRVIHVIPFTSIIEQTAGIFRGILGADHVLEHHASIEDRAAPDDLNASAARDKMRLAMEDWAAPVVVTTAVQLFESLFAARPSRARKLHNIAGSVIVLDEAQTLPRPLLRPCLTMLDRLARHWRCSIILCTATQPAVDVEQLSGGLALKGRELAPDPAALNARMRRVRMAHAGVMADADLVAALTDHPQALVIVNSRAHALELFRAAAHLDGTIHLSTRQHARDRQRILEDVSSRLRDGRPCRLIATSLVEAGVDLDFPIGWRAEAGLDQIVQAAGRVNREHRRPLEDSLLTVFRPAQHQPPAEVKALIGDMQQIMARHDDLLSPAAMKDYFTQVYWRAETGKPGLDAKGILPRLRMSAGATLPRHFTDFAFRSIAAEFRMIEDGLAPVIVPTTPEAEAIVARLAGEESSGKLAREAQPFVVQVPPRARAAMIGAGAVEFAAPTRRGDQFAVLRHRHLYTPETGLLWEAAGTLDPLDLVI